MDRVNTSLAFETVLETIRNGTFDGYDFPESVVDVIPFQSELRTHINTVFNRNNMPTYYDVGMLLFIYQTTSSQLDEIDTWDKFKDTVAVCSVVAVSNPEKNVYKCLCSQDICNQHWITSHSKYALLGSVCIRKNGGKLAEQMYIADHYNCIECNISVSNHGDYFHQKLCHNCYDSPKSICVKCKKNLHCPNGLCSSCKNTWTTCTVHPTVCLSIKRKQQCNHCIEQPSRERIMMGQYDDIEQRWTRERIEERTRVERERFAESRERYIMAQCDDIEQQRTRERLERARLNREAKEERERVRYQWIAKKLQEQERLEKERLEQEQLKQERLEYELVEKARIRLEQQKQYKHNQEQARLEIERVKHENREKVRLYNERLEKDRLEKERIKLENREKVRLYNLKKK